MGKPKSDNKSLPNSKSPRPVHITNCFDSKECQERAGPDIFSMLADVTLSSEAPSESKSALLVHAQNHRLNCAPVMITSLQQIINATWGHDKSDIEKLSRWIRCLFTIALTSNDKTAEQLLDQVAAIAQNAKQVSHAARLIYYAANKLDSNRWCTHPKS